MANADVKTSKREIVGEEVQWGIAFLHELRADIRELRSEINDVRQVIDSKYKMLDQKIDSKYEMLDQKIDSKHGILDQKIDDLRKEMHRQLYWIIGTMIAIGGAIIAVMKI